MLDRRKARPIVARTHRAHLSPAERTKQGRDGKEREPKALIKTHKQKRPNEKAQLRKEHL